MFFNAEHFGTMLKVLALLLAVVVYLLAVHAIWIRRLARSLQGRIPSNGIRAGILALATLTPLLSYYVVGSVRRIRGTGPGKRWGLVPVGLIVAFAGLWLLPGVLGVAVAGRTSDGRLEPLRIGLNWVLFAGSWFLIIFMIVRVFSSLPTFRSVAIVVAVTSVSIAFLIAPYP